jgi:integrase
MGVKLRERPGKGWYVLIDWKGKRKAKAFGKDEKSAQLFAQKMAYRLKEGEHVGTSVSLDDSPTIRKPMPTVKAYLSKWQETYAKPNCKPSTYRGYARAIEQVLIPQFGHLPLNELEREHVRSLIAELTQQGKARGTIENCLVPLKAVYYQAMEDGVVKTNPAARLGRIFKRKKDRRAGIAPLEREEENHLLHTVKEKYPRLYPLILCAARTGLRQGELIGLQWGDVDFHGGFIEVRRGVVLRQETTTKSHKIRRVDMSQHLQATLMNLKELKQLEAMAEGRELAPWVFLAKGGQRWDDRHLRRIWVKCLEAAGLRHVRFHDLRHTYASELAEQGAPPKYVQSQLGHSSIQVTMDVYSHFFEKRSREWVNKLDEITDEGSRNSVARGESATPTQPELVGQEEQTDKLLKLLVAVEGFEPPARGL